MLTINNAVKIFSQGTPNEHKALSGLNLHLERGEFVTVVGSNGAGKSTMFNAICGNFLLNSGSIFVDGQNITYMKEHKRAGFIGRVFQDPMKGTAPNLTIEENLALAYSRQKTGPFGAAVNKKNRDMFKEALSEFNMGLEDRMQTKVGLLSGGQRQAMALLMATMTDIKFLILDEHTAALDPKTADLIMKITDDVVREKHLTTVMVTHNLRYAVEYGSRLIMMNQGHIVMDKGGDEKANLNVDDILDVFNKISIECGN